MQQKIAVISGLPDFDSLNVIKLRCEKEVDINSRIFAQGQICQNEDSIYIRILSFESRPTADSAAAAEFSLGEKAIKLVVTFGGTAFAEINGEKRTDCFTSYTTTGEDLQGEYWSAVIKLPLKLLFDSLGVSKGDAPLVLSGNLCRFEPEYSAAALKGEKLEFLL